jgi:hypothetical protein
MQVLARVHDGDVAGRIVSLLHAKGIPTFVKSGRVGVPGFGPATYVIFVCLDSHVEDAHKLLDDPGHVVQQPVDVETYKRDAAGVDSRQVKWGALVLAAVVLAITALFLGLDIPVFRP